MTDDPLTTCPECKGEIHRMIFANGIVFKGSGFYINDSRHSSASAVPSSENTAAAPAAETAETKPAADTSAAPAEKAPAPTETKAPVSASTEKK